MKSATKWILFFAVQVNKYNISRANFSFSCHEQFIITEFVIAFSQSKKQSFFLFFFFFFGGGGGGFGYYDHAFNFHPSFSSASFPLFLFSFGYSVFFFFFFLFCFGFLHHCHCETTPLQEDIITLTSGVTSHYIVLHPVSNRASRTSGLCVQFIHHS